MANIKYALFILFMVFLLAASQQILAVSISKDIFPDTLQGLVLNETEDLTSALHKDKLEEYGLQKWYGAYYFEPKAEEKKIAATIASFDEANSLSEFVEDLIAATQQVGIDECEANWSKAQNTEVDGFSAKYLERSSSPFYLDFCFLYETYLFISGNNHFLMVVISQDDEQPSLSEAKKAAELLIGALGLLEEEGTDSSEVDVSPAEPANGAQRPINSQTKNLFWLWVAIGSAIAIISFFTFKLIHKH